LESELAKELENGRLLRLLVKLGFVNERPDGDMDTEWAETGDRYILKLFRDYVFHQHNDQGSPVMDWGHVFESLNKLDVGVSERVLLLSRDEMSMLVASYADIKRCVDGAYAELLQSSKAYN
jgi:PAB-dependent poly(A)-specific ribonuclease subunit 3